MNDHLQHQMPEPDLPSSTKILSPSGASSSLPSLPYLWEILGLEAGTNQLHQPTKSLLLRGGYVASWGTLPPSNQFSFVRAPSTRIL